MGRAPQKSWGRADPAGLKALTPVSAIPYLTQVSDTFLDTCRVEMKCADQQAEIHYTLDGTPPEVSSPKFVAPFEITNTTTLKLRSFAPPSAPSIVVTRTLARSEAFAPATAPLPGLQYAYYEGIYRSIHDFAKDHPVAQGVVAMPTTAVCLRTNWIATTFDGLIQIPQDGSYTFYVAAKDGGQLLIDGGEQFESDGRKDVALPQQSTIALRAGFHRFGLKTYKCTDTISLAVEWSGPNLPRTPSPKEVFYHLPADKKI